jgi:hypothetical protein
MIPNSDLAGQGLHRNQARHQATGPAAAPPRVNGAGVGPTGSAGNLIDFAADSSGGPVTGPSAAAAKPAGYPGRSAAGTMDGAAICDGTLTGVLKIHTVLRPVVGRFSPSDLRSPRRRSQTSIGARRPRVQDNPL